MKASEALVIGGFYVDAQIRQPKYSFAVRFNKIASTGNNISRSYKMADAEILSKRLNTMFKNLMHLLSEVKEFTKDDFERFRPQWHLILKDSQFVIQRVGLGKQERVEKAFRQSSWDAVVQTMHAVNLIGVSLNTILSASNILDEKLKQIKLTND